MDLDTCSRRTHVVPHISISIYAYNICVALFLFRFQCSSAEFTIVCHRVSYVSYFRFYCFFFFFWPCVAYLPDRYPPISFLSFDTRAFFPPVISFLYIHLYLNLYTRRLKKRSVHACDAIFSASISFFVLTPLV